LKIKIKIPIGSKAEFWCPYNEKAQEIKEQENIIWDKKAGFKKLNGIEFIKKENQFILFQLGSGKYLFNISID